MREPEVDVQEYWRRGFTLVRGVFGADEIERLRESAQRTREHPGDLLTNPELRHVLLDPRLARVVSRLLGARPIYFGYSSVRFGADGRGYHKDNADRSDGSAPDWRGPYTLLRCGLYLQDHSRHSGGLNVRDGSHNQPDVRRGRTVYLASRPGDLVVWNLRTSHSANGIVLRGLRGLPVPPDSVKHLPNWLISPFERERIAVFMTFAKDGPHFQRYLRYLKTRRYMVDLWRASSPLPVDLPAHDLEIRDVWPAMSGDPEAGKNVEHAPLPD
jgi:hypothetical protein